MRIIIKPCINVDGFFGQFISLDLFVGKVKPKAGIYDQLLTLKFHQSSQLKRAKENEGIQFMWERPQFTSTISRLPFVFIHNTNKTLKYNNDMQRIKLHNYGAIAEQIETLEWP